MNVRSSQSPLISVASFSNACEPLSRSRNSPVQPIRSRGTPSPCGRNCGGAERRLARATPGEAATYCAALIVFFCFGFCFLFSGVIFFWSKTFAARSAFRTFPPHSNPSRPSIVYNCHQRRKEKGKCAGVGEATRGNGRRKSEKPQPIAEVERALNRFKPFPSLLCSLLSPLSPFLPPQGAAFDPREMRQ